MSDNFITAKGVKRCFPVSGDEFWALKGVDVEIPRGKLTILKGRSGSGKTTLLNILGALDKPTEGSVMQGDHDIVRLSERRRAHVRRKEVGFVFQSVALIPMMNAIENVEYALRMARAKGNHHERALECLKMVGLGGRTLHMPQEMSGGEQQRVAIARAIATSPRLILADEPTGNLDEESAMQVTSILKRLNETGVTIVLITHDAKVAKTAGRTLQIHTGKIIGDTLAVPPITF